MSNMCNNIHNAVDVTIQRVNQYHSCGSTLAAADRCAHDIRGILTVFGHAQRRLSFSVGPLLLAFHFLRKHAIFYSNKRANDKQRVHMVELLTYPTEQLPPIWKWQVLSFLRAIWPEGFVGENRLRDWITKSEDHPVS